MLTRQISMNVKHNQKHIMSNLVSMIEKPFDISLVGPLLIWLRKPPWVLTSKPSPRRNCSSLLVMSLETMKGTSYLSRRIYTDFKLLDYNGMRDSLTVYVEWASFLARQSLTSGCEKRPTIGSTLVLTLMTWPSLAKGTIPLATQERRSF